MEKRKTRGTRGHFYPKNKIKGKEVVVRISQHEGGKLKGT